MNYFPFHIGDYLSATRHLSWEEDLAYRRVLDTYYTNEKPLPAEVKQVCPLQFDIVDRLIERYSNKGERVYDPFCGLGTVPYRAILKGRTGGGSELNTAYFMDQVHYLKSAEKQFTMPTLFDAMDAEELEAA